MATAAVTAIVHHTGMSELTCIAEVTLMVSALRKEATAQAYTQTDDDEILHTMSTTKGVLTQCRHMSIVGEGHSQSQTVAQHGCHRDDTLPRQVGRVLDTS